MHCGREATVWLPHWSLVSLSWMNCRHHYCGPCSKAFTTTQPFHKAQAQTAACSWPGKRKLYCFPISAWSFTRASSSHRGIAHKEGGQTTVADSRGLLTAGEKGEEEEEGKVGVIHLCMFKSAALTATFPTFEENLFCKQPVASPGPFFKSQKCANQSKSEL